MTPATQQERARAFHALHRGDGILVLANAWDAASARIFELAGFAAIGTTSAGVAWSLGCPDGEHLELQDLVRAVARIVATVEVPVTVDLEAGYGETPAAVCRSVEAVIAAGAVGVNLEDRMAEAAVLAEKIAAVRQLPAAAALPLFINARTDVYLRGATRGEARFEEAAHRTRRYVEAGADGVFVPGLVDLDEIVRLARAVARPLNVYAGAGVPEVEALRRAGVARVSVGCGPMQAVLALTRQIAAALLSDGTYDAFSRSALPYAEVNAMFARDPGRRVA